MGNSDDDLNNRDVSPDEKAFPSEKTIRISIDEYRRKPLEAVNAELHAHGIDPRITIDAVLALVEKALRESERGKIHEGSHRRGVHVPRIEASVVIVLIAVSVVIIVTATVAACARRNHGRAGRRRVVRVPFSRHRSPHAKAA